MIPIEDLNDVTLVIEDTDEYDEEDLTDVTLVSDDADSILDSVHTKFWKPQARLQFTTHGTSSWVKILIGNSCIL